MLGLFLERMQHVDCATEPHRIHSPKRIIAFIRYNFEDSGTEALQRFGLSMFKPELCLVERESDLAAYCFWKRSQDLERIAQPDNSLKRPGLFSNLHQSHRMPILA